MGTLLGNKSFRESAYAATSTEDLVAGINDFFEDAILLPPWRGEDKDPCRRAIDGRKRVALQKAPQSVRDHTDDAGHEPDHHAESIRIVVFGWWGRAIGDRQ